MRNITLIIFATLFSLSFAQTEVRTPDEWFKEGDRYMVASDYNLAIPCMERAAEGFHVEANKEGELEAWYEIGVMMRFMEKYTKALEAFNNAYSIAKDINADDWEMKILRLVQKINVSLDNAKEQARIDAMMDSIASSTNNDTVRFDYNRYKGEEAMKFKRYNIAELWFMKNDALVNASQENRTNIFGQQHYGDLRDVCIYQKKYDDALRYAYLSKNALQARMDSSSTNYYLPYLMIAMIHSHMGDNDGFANAIDTAFISVEQMEEPKSKAWYYEMKAIGYQNLKNHDLALRSYKEADSVLATKYPQDDDKRMEMLPQMAGIEFATEDYSNCVKHLSIYLDYISKTMGETNTRYVYVVSNLAVAMAYAGDVDGGQKYYEACIESIKRIIKQCMPYYTANEREGFWSIFSPIIMNIVPFATSSQGQSDTFTRSSYDALVMSKSFLLESERSIYDLIKRYGTEEDLECFSLMASMQAKVKTLEKDYIKNAESIMSITAELDSIGKEFASRCRLYGDLTAFMNVDYNDIKTSLRDDEVVLDFADYVTADDERTYTAYIIDNKHESPTLKKLFLERWFDSLDIQRPDLCYEQLYSKDILHMLWEPITDYVPEGSTVYYVPSQLLFQIALESFQLEDGSLLSDHYKFVRLSSARELVRMKDNASVAINPDKAVLYGGLQYDVDPLYMAMEAKKYDVTNLLAMRREIVANGGSIFSELPGTKRETEEIDSILSERGLDVSLFSSTSGTEESFMSMDGHAPDILHMATHGFYYDAAEAQDVSFLKGNTDAMMLSGLVMSGGNAAWLGKELPEGVLGGILTANNISCLDLSGVELAVLSACKTGQGKATAEGLFGLQRAFKKAGVKTIVMTLWSVDDFATREFMVKFYENMSFDDKGWNKRKAFDEAKAFVRSRYPEAYYWAAFVMLD